MNIKSATFFKTNHISLLLRGLLLAVLLIPGVGTGLGVMQEERAVDVVKPVITRRQYRRFCDQIGVSRDQWMILELVYRDYTKDLTELIQATDAVADEAGRERLHAALAGKIRLGREELRGLRLSVLEAGVSGGKAAAELAANLIDSTEVMLLEEQWASYERARFELRRNILLHPRHPRRPEAAPADYAGEGVDICLLVEEEKGEDGSLAGLEERTIAAILEPYVREMDDLLRDSGAWRQAEVDLRKARIQRDDDNYQKAQRELIRHWRRIYELNQRTAKQLGVAVERDSDVTVRDAWLLAFDRACFPRVFRERKPDRIMEWIRHNALLRGDNIIKSELEYVVWQIAWLKLARLEMILMKRGRIELKAVVTPVMDPMDLTDGRVRDLYEEMLRLSGRQSTLEAEHSAILEALLDDEQRKRMNREVRRGRRRR